MKKHTVYITFLCIICLVSLINTILICFLYFDKSFAFQVSKKQTTTVKANSLKDINVVKKNRDDKLEQKFKADTFLTDYSSIISGKEPQKYFKKIYESDEWKQAQASINREWDYVTKKKINKIKPWADSTILNKVSGKNLFYPFAGADFLYSNLFFNNTDSIIMIGLERPGSIITDSLNLNYFLSHIKKIEKALYFSNHVGFFRTKSMEEDLNSTELNGTLPTILFYMSRMGYNISGIKYLKIDSLGKLKYENSINSYGYQIEYFNETNKLRRLFYFRQDLSNNTLIKDKKILRFLDKVSTPNTLIKSASYLLHHESFSILRNFLLEKSRLILQDDSGIPYKYFNYNTWNLFLFGEYTRTIPLFKNSYQPTLFQAYKSLNKKRLPFFMGYNINHGETNLLLSLRK